ncbi:hypothetical protein LGH83_00750 [Lichenihabitans sp. PAMC28606]|uniref:hypothetical protein n=1 Tax=Lichenihabitans sp. PAMC28606 TaxID=2880932 RepID=UPI001D0B616F|nr:hypothetical protein [Lichenihabitans sp. PAMC28606]UDL94845.1 hypothetical protein LGH83_00750 [Lichenihabitans sp. PAMC28606]
MAEHDHRKNSDVGGGRRSTVAALIFVVILIGGVYWAFQAIVQHNAMQNCLDSGRRDCTDRLP